MLLVLLHVHVCAVVTFVCLLIVIAARVKGDRTQDQEDVTKLSDEEKEKLPDHKLGEIRCI